MHSTRKLLGFFSVSQEHENEIKKNSIVVEINKIYKIIIRDAHTATVFIRFFIRTSRK